MSKTYEMRNNQEYSNIENNIKSQQLHNNYLEDIYLSPEYDSNFNVNIFKNIIFFISK